MGKDELKKQVALANGYNIMYLWDSEYRTVSKDRKEKILNKCINFLISKQ